MSTSIIAKVSFPNLTVIADELEEFGGESPDTEFEIKFNDDPKDEEPYSIHYQSADETVTGKSIKKVAKKIKDFLEGDSAVNKTGSYVIKILR